MDEIAEVAGISKPMVYAYLGTKDELFVACLHREATRLMEAVAAGVLPTARPDEQLWHGLRAFFTFVGDHRDGWRVLYRQARSEPHFAGELAGMRARIVEVVAGLLESAATAAEVPGRPSTSPRWRMPTSARPNPSPTGWPTTRRRTPTTPRRG